MTEIEIIIAMHEVLEKEGVPATEELYLTEGENDRGKILSSIGAIVEAQSTPGKTIWVARTNGRLFGLIYRAPNEYELIRL